MPTGNPTGNNDTARTNVRFYRSENFPTSNIKQGTIYFSYGTNTIGVGKSSTEIEKYFGGKVNNVSFDSESKVLTITYNDDTAAQTLNFSDTASASGVNAVLSGLAGRLDKVEVNHIGLAKGEDGVIASSISYEDTNYLTETSNLIGADKALDAAIKAVANKVGENNVSQQITDAINGLDATKTQEASDANGQLELSITETDGKIASISGSIKAETYDTYGAAAAVLGSDADTAESKTVYGAIKAAEAASSKVGTEIAKLDATVDNGDSQADGIKVTVVETDGKLTSVSVASSIKTDLIGVATGEGASTKDSSTIEGAKRYADSKVDALDLTQVGAAGSYIKLVSQTDGKVSATAQTFETSIPTGNEEASSTNAPTAAAVKTYVNSAVADLNGAMHFKGAVDAVPTDNSTYKSGDVVFISSSKKEYVFDGTNWIELGDESMVGSAISALDATVSNTTVDGENTSINNSDGIKVTVVETDGKLTSVAVESGIKSALIGADTDAAAADTVYGAKAYADAAVSTFKTDVTGTPDTGKTLQGEIDALETLVGTTGVAKQISDAIEGLDATVSSSTIVTEGESKDVASSQIKVQVVEEDGKLTGVSVYAPSFEAAGAETRAKNYTDTEIGKLDHESTGAAGSYIQKVAESNGIVTETVVAFDTTIGEASTNDNAPTSLAVKTYVDSAVSNKNVSAEGDSDCISASATGNKVTVTGTYAEMSTAVANGDLQGSVDTEGIVKGSEMKSYVDEMLTWVNF